MATPRNGSTAKQRPHLEILPDARFVVFAGTEHEASTTKLTGCVRLHCPEATSISRPRIRLEGRRKISWINIAPVSSSVIEDKRTFVNRERKLGSIESTHKVNAGIIEWPFEFDLSPQMPESVEGLPDTFIAYHLHATVSRPGWNQRDITERAHIRIVRTLGSDSLETTRSRVNADIWANKISYNISIPSDAIIFGTCITADVELSPIRKGIKLGRVEMKLIETVIKRISDGTDTPSTRPDKAKSEESEVARSHMDFPESTKVTYEGETAEDPVVADEMYKFQATLPLPKSLHKCRQDVDSHQINITHRFKLMVNIHNPEGHISQLVCRLPIKIFISPNLPIDEANEVQVSEATANSIGSSLVAPPQYGQHQLDQIFSDIDPSGYMSRAGSNTATPAGIFAQSRRGSEDNLRMLQASADPSASHGSAAPAALISRLAGLQDGNSELISTSPRSNSTSPVPVMNRRAAQAEPSGITHALGQSPDNSDEPSRRSSAEDEAETQQHQQGLRAQFDLLDLSRVPSYNAAIRSTGPSTSYSDHPPSYIDATSQEPSRAASPSQSPQLTSRSNSYTGVVASSRNLEPGSGRTEDEARLRTLRART